jgi:hypothetical protein
MAEADYDDEMSAADLKVRSWSAHLNRPQWSGQGCGLRDHLHLAPCTKRPHEHALIHMVAHTRLHAFTRRQAALLDSLFGTERGLAARSEVRAEINELITQLEAKNPTPSPTEVRCAHCTPVRVPELLRCSAA